MNRLQYPSPNQTEAHHKASSNKSSPTKQSLLNGEFTEFHLKVKTISPSCGASFTTNERCSALEYLVGCLSTSLKSLDHHQTKEDIDRHETMVKIIINSISELLLGNNPLDYQVKHSALSSLNKLLTSLTNHSRAGKFFKDYAISLLPAIISSLSEFRTSVKGRFPPGTVTLKLIGSLCPPDTSVTMLKSVIDNGLYSSNEDLRRITSIILPSLLTPPLHLDFLYQGYPPLVKEDEASSTCLAASLMAAAIQYLNRSDLQEVLLQSLNALRLQIGDENFVEQLDKLPRKFQKAYLEACREFSNRRIQNQNSQTSLRLSQSSSVEQLDQISNLNSSFTQDSCTTPRNHQNNSAPADPSWRTRSNIVAGFIPVDVIEQLSSKDSKMRFKAVEQMRNNFEELCGKKRCSEILVNNISELLPIMKDLLNDSNFHIVKTSLEMLAGIVGKSSTSIYNASESAGIRPYSDQLISMLLKSLGDNKKVVQMWVMRYAMTLMRQLETEKVLSQLGKLGLYHRNSRIRQETIDIIIGALLQFPSGDFDLENLCQLISPTLADRKQTVRYASLECFAVLAHLLGAGRLGPMVDAINEIDLQVYSKSSESISLVEVVRQRLSRHQLPRLTNQGLVEYASSRSDNRVVSASGNSDLQAITHESTPNEIKREASDILDATRRPSGAKSRNLHKLPWQSEMSSMDLSSDAREKTRSTSLSKISMRTDDSSSGMQSIRSSNSSFMDLTKTDNILGLSKETPLINKFNKLPMPNISNSSKSMPCSGKSSPQNPANSSDWNAGSQSTREVVTYPTEPPNDQDLPSHVSAKNDLKTLLSMDNPFPTKPTLLRSASKRHDSATSTRTNSAESRVVSGYSTASRETSASIFNDSRHYYVTSDNSSMVEDTLENQLRSRSDQDSGFSSRGAHSVYTEAATDDTQNREFSNSQDEDPTQFAQSLMSIRNSANKKKAATRRKAMDEKNKSKESEKTELGMKASATRGPTTESPTSPTSYSPYSGATFKANPNYNGLVVGRGYAEDNVSAAPEAEFLSNQSDNKTADKRKLPIKGASSLSRMGTLASNSFKNSFDSDDQTQTSPSHQTNEEIFNVIGKRMFDSSGRWESEKGKSKPGDTAGENYLMDESDPTDQQTTVDKAESTRNQRPPAAPKGHPRRKSTVQPVMMPSSKSIHRSRSENQLNDMNSHPNSALSHTVASVDYSSNKRESSARPLSPLTPLPQPIKSISIALEQLSNSDWQEKIEGLRLIQQLVHFHCDVVANRSVDLHQIQFAVCAECKNLRSQVSRMSIQTLGLIYQSLKKACETDLEQTVKILLSRSGECNAFIREDIDMALSAMVDSVTPQKAIAALLQTGAEHPNSNIRRTCAMHLCHLCQNIGPGRVLSGIKEITDKVLSSVSKFVQDRNAETRYFGRKILNDLMHHQDFDKYLKKCILANDYKSVRDIVDSIKLKGLGALPQSFVRRSTSISRDGSARSSVRSLSGSGTLKYGSTQDLPSEVEVSSHDPQDPLSNILLIMVSPDWRQRIRGIQELSNLVEEDLSNFTENINRIFEKLCPRLIDSNSKVTQIALQSLTCIMPQISHALTPHVIGSIVQHTVTNLTSSNADNSMCAANILDSLIHYANSAHVLASLVQSLTNASNKIKIQLWSKVAELCLEILSKKDQEDNQRLLIRHLYPELFKQLQLIVNRRQDDPLLMEALRDVVLTLYLYVGEDLIERARLSAPSVVDLLEEMINSDSDR